MLSVNSLDVVSMNAFGGNKPNNSASNLINSSSMTASKSSRLGEMTKDQDVDNSQSSPNLLTSSSSFSLKLVSPEDGKVVYDSQSLCSSPSVNKSSSISSDTSNCKISMDDILAEIPDVNNETQEKYQPSDDEQVVIDDDSSREDNDNELSLTKLRHGIKTEMSLLARLKDLKKNSSSKLQELQTSSTLSRMFTFKKIMTTEEKNIEIACVKKDIAEIDCHIQQGHNNVETIRKEIKNKTLAINKEKAMLANPGIQELISSLGEEEADKLINSLIEAELFQQDVDEEMSLYEERPFCMA